MFWTRTLSTAVALVALLSACAGGPPALPPAARDPQWVDTEPADFPWASAQNVAGARYARVDDNELTRAMERLRAAPIVALSKLQLDADFPATAATLADSERYHLVRGFSDPTGAAYSLRYADGRLTVYHTEMGPCATLIRSAFIVAIDGPVREIYGGCSGAM